MGGVPPTMGGVSPIQAQPIEDEKPMLAISVDVESADYGEEELETERLFDEAVCLLSEAARVSARRAMEHLQSPDSNFLVKVEDATRSNCADGLVAGSDLKIVMCLATYCCTSQLKAALPINLASSWGLRDRVIWVLADMNDEEESSTLLAWLAESVAASLVSGQLYVVRRVEAWSGWHACFAKNTSHIVGTSIAGAVPGSKSGAPNVILVNCDSDNLPSLSFVAYLLDHHADMCTRVHGGAQNMGGPG